tara:strand:- start:123 stop:320 length:198 start_codon:yes stop_codon:yes gene_type:complete
MFRGSFRPFPELNLPPAKPLPLMFAVKGNAIGRNSSSTFHSSPGASFSDIPGAIAQASSDENPAF